MTTNLRVIASIIAATLTAGCSQILGLEQPEASLERDGAIDAPVIDGAVDAPVNLPDDAQVDGQVSPLPCPPGEPCCTAQGQFEKDTKVCDTTFEFQCGEGDRCGGRRQKREVQKFCSGSSPKCNGDFKNGDWQDLTACEANRVCTPVDNAAPECTLCQFGCRANVCQQQTLSIFESIGTYPANLGGRNGLDAKCQEARISLGLQCDINNTHAIVGVSDTEKLGDLQRKFNIPDNAPVQRGSDRAPVAPNWAKLMDLRTTLSNPPYGGAGALPLWTGALAPSDPTCKGWTSESSTDRGISGEGSDKSTWFSKFTKGCQELKALMCICWHEP